MAQETTTPKDGYLTRAHNTVSRRTLIKILDHCINDSLISVEDIKEIAEVVGTRTRRLKLLKQLTE